MKTLSSMIRLVLIGSLLNGLSVACRPTNNNGLSPLASCRIQRVTGAFQGQYSQGITQTEYTYNAQGNLVNKTSTYEGTSSGSESDNTTTSDTYVYDANSFLTKSTTDIHRVNTFAGKREEFHSVLTKVYAYLSGRLSGYTQTEVTGSNLPSDPQQHTLVTTVSFAYDASGQLLKQNASNGESTIYQNGKPQAMAMSGDVHFELQDGLIIKITFPGTNAQGPPSKMVHLNQYDQQRRLIKHEEFVNDTLKTYYTQEWQSGQPAEATLPAWKGHPLVESPYGRVGVLARYQVYWVNAQQAATLNYEQRLENQLNGSSYVNNTNKSDYYPTSGGRQPDVTRTTYTYEGCH